MKTKEDFRKFFRNKRNGLSDEALIDLSGKINSNFKEFFEKHPEWQDVHVFIPIRNRKELDIFPTIAYLWSLGCKVYTSKMNYRKDLMETVLFPSYAEILFDEKSIPYPSRASVVSSESLQLILVPLLAFDVNGNRLGYGKGYYDKFFSSIQWNKIFKLGVSLFDPIEELPHEPHDIPLDGCLFPGGIMYF